LSKRRRSKRLRPRNHPPPKLRVEMRDMEEGVDVGGVVEGAVEGADPPPEARGA
jgi:hypothetical protein